MSTPETNGKHMKNKGFRRKMSKIDQLRAAPETKQAGKASRERKDIRLSAFQLEYQKTQIGRLETSEKLLNEIPANAQEIYIQLKQSGKNALQIKGAVQELPVKTQIAIAKTLSSEALIQGAFEQYALNIDGLTGLNKEQALVSYLEEKKANNTPVAGIHFDIDKFKDFNDSYGHAAGDEVLQVAAKIVMQLRGESGFAARNHDRGEEFTLLFSADEMTAEEKEKYGNDVHTLALEKAEQIKSLLTEEEFLFKNIKTEGGQIEKKTVTASIGVAEMRDVELVQDFRNRMEHASSYAKNVDGRNAVKVFDEAVDEWYLQEIAQQSSDSMDALEAVQDDSAHHVEQINPITARKTKTIEIIQNSGSISEEYSDNHLSLRIALENALMQGNLPEITELEAMLEEVQLSNTEINDIWFYHAALAETNSEIFGDQARRDTLTNLYNRQEVGRQLKETLSEARESNEVVSIALLDMDFFKKVNDTYGHDVGDEMLKKVASFLKEAVSHFDTPPFIGKGRSEDAARSTELNGITGRWGGEEFFIFVPGMDAETLKNEIEEHIVSKIGKIEFNIERNGKTFTIRQTLSFGITQNKSGENMRPENEMLEEADKALYASKLLGRNQANIFSEDLSQKAAQLEKERQEKLGTDERIR